LISGVAGGAIIMLCVGLYVIWMKYIRTKKHKSTPVNAEERSTGMAPVQTAATGNRVNPDGDAAVRSARISTAAPHQPQNTQVKEFASKNGDVEGIKKTTDGHYSLSKTLQERTFGNMGSKAPNGRRFPISWGEPPDTNDAPTETLDGEYGGKNVRVSSTMKKWVEQRSQRESMQTTLKTGNCMQKQPFPDNWPDPIPPKEFTTQNTACTKYCGKYGWGPKWMADWVQTQMNIDGRPCNV